MLLWCAYNFKLKQSVYCLFEMPLTLLVLKSPTLALVRLTLMLVEILVHYLQKMMSQELNDRRLSVT